MTAATDRYGRGGGTAKGWRRSIVNEGAVGSTPRINPRFLRVIQSLVLILSMGLLIAHTFAWKSVRVDSVTLALLGIILVTPLITLIRRVRLGDFEAEIGQEEVDRARAKASTEIPSIEEDGLDPLEERIRQLVREDERLALAQVRILLEDALRRLHLARLEGSEISSRMSLARLVDKLSKDEIINPTLNGALRDVIGLANRAVHGESVETAVAEDLALLGVRLVRELQRTRQDLLRTPVEKSVISSNEVEEFRNARYRVTTIVPLVTDPYKNVYLVDQEGLDDLLEGYSEYAEFIVKLERVDDAIVTRNDG